MQSLDGSIRRPVEMWTVFSHKKTRTGEAANIIKSAENWRKKKNLKNENRLQLKLIYSAQLSGEVAEMMARVVAVSRKEVPSSLS